MGWKRIMSKRHGKTGKKREVNAQKTAKAKKITDAKKTTAVEEAAKKEIQQYFVRLLPEMNLRLLLDTESVMEESKETGRGHLMNPPARLLWLEAITVTAYQPIPCRAESQKPGVIQTWKHFIKNKKERR